MNNIYEKPEVEFVALVSKESITGGWGADGDQNLQSNPGFTFPSFG